MLRYAKSLVLAGAVGVSLLALNTPAQANVTPTFDSVVPVSGVFEWTYDVTLDSDQFMVDDGASFVTIYDFLGYVPGSGVAPAGWVFSSANTGLNAFAPGVIPDNPGIPNLTWTWVGTGASPESLLPLMGEIDFFGFKARSLFGGEQAGQYGAMARNYDPRPGSSIHGRATMNKGFVPVPVPEPATMALLGLGAAPLLRLRRRNRKA